MNWNVHGALCEVRELRERIIAKQRFKGYSGRARALSGCIALGTALVLRTWWPEAPPATLLLAWAAAAAVAAVLNFGTLAYWFLTDTERGRDVRRLQPVLVAVPFLVAAICLSLSLAQHGGWDLLYGCWMLLHGLLHFASVGALPPRITWVGWFYVIAGSTALLLAPGSFNLLLFPGLAFFFGEWLAGLLMHFDERPGGDFLAFLGLASHHRSAHEDT